MAEPDTKRRGTEMSLRFFHAFFIGASSLMALGVGIWAVGRWQTDAAMGWLALAALSLASAVALVFYGTRFLQKTRKLGIVGVLLGVMLGIPSDALACTVCIGNTDSVMAAGMNNGILVLLGVIGSVLACFAWFIVSLARRARYAEVPDSVVRRPSTKVGQQIEKQILAREGV
jgi:hypothetical protein